MREQIETLKNHAHTLAQLSHGQRVGVQQGLAIDGECALLEHLQAVDTSQQRALARAAFADDGNHFALLHLQVYALEHFVVTIRFAQSGDLHNGAVGRGRGSD